MQNREFQRQRDSSSFFRPSSNDDDDDDDGRYRRLVQQYHLRPASDVGRRRGIAPAEPRVQEDGPGRKAEGKFKSGSVAEHKINATARN